MKAVVYIVLATAFIYYVARFAGALLLQALGAKLSRSEHRFIGFVCGSALLSTLVFLITAAGLAYKAAFICAGVLILAIGFYRGAHRAGGPAFPPASPAWNAAFWTVYLAFGWWYLSLALAPETSSDGLFYHVALITRYLREHHFPLITTNMYANLSAGIEMLFLFAFSIGKHSAAAMVEFLFLAIAPFGIMSYGRRIGKPVAGIVAALLFYSAPVVGRTGTIAYVDVATACVAFALFYLLQMWREERQDALLIPIGLIAGFGYAAKYTAFTGVIYALLFTGYWLWRWKRPIGKPLLIIAACASSMMAPWMVKNNLIVQNPFSPFLNRYFPNPYVYVSFERDYIAALSHMGGVRPPEIPLEVTVRGERLPGLIGPVFLLAPLALLSLRTAAGRQVLLAAAVFMAPYAGNIGTRFLIPALPFISLGLALAVHRVRFIAALILIAHAISCWPPLVNLYCSQNAWRIERTTWPAALRRTPEAEYIRASIPDYDLGVILDRRVPVHDRVLGNMANHAYHSREVLEPYASAFGTRLYDMLVRVTIADMQPAWRHVFQFRGRPVRKIRLVETRAAGVSWAISEVRVFSGGSEVTRNPAWRLRALANPWDVELAFDHNPVTLWNARDVSTPGMFIEIDFGKEESVDRITADLPRNLGELAMRVDAEVSPGKWEPLQNGAITEDVPYPAGMRRAAIDKLKANGIQWLLSEDGDQMSKDYIDRAAEWGITQVAVSNGFRLWHLD